MPGSVEHTAAVLTWITIALIIALTIVISTVLWTMDRKKRASRDKEAEE